MSMIGEILAEMDAKDNAKKLELIILNLIKGSDWGDVRSAAKGIAKKELYTWYKSECSSGDIEPHVEIVNMFEKE